MTLEVVVSLETCHDCRHIDHVHSQGGMKYICNHDCAVECFTKDKILRGKDDKYHWRHRVIKCPGKIPGLCPLRHKHKY